MIKDCVHNPIHINDCTDIECIKIECPVQPLDIPDDSPGLLDNTNIVAIYSKPLSMYRTILSCTFGVNEANTICRNMLNSKFINA